MKKNILSLSIFLFLFGGCEATIVSSVKASSLLALEASVVKSQLLIEVTSCSSYEDSRKPSSSVIKAKQVIPEIFQGVEYKDCFSKEMTSYANFMLPIQVGTDKPSSSQISILSNKENLLYVTMPSYIKQKIKEVENREMSSISKMSINLRLQNDMKKKFSFKVLSSYVRGVPYIDRGYTLDDGKSIELLLSNTSADEALYYNKSIILKY